MNKGLRWKIFYRAAAKKEKAGGKDKKEEYGSP